MEKEQVKARVIRVIARVLALEEEEISPDANFIFDLGADSMQSLELVAALEEEFGIEMEEDEALSRQTVSEAVDFIKKIIGGKG